VCEAETLCIEHLLRLLLWQHCLSCFRCYSVAATVMTYLCGAGQFICLSLLPLIVVAVPATGHGRKVLPVVGRLEG
jgi:hypothetical protein